MKYQNEWMGFRKEPLELVDTAIKKKTLHALRLISARKSYFTKIIAAVQKTARKKTVAVSA